MTNNVIDRICANSNTGISNAFRARSYMAEMYLDCMELTEGDDTQHNLLLEFFDQFIISIVVGMLENVQGTMAIKNEMFEKILAELGIPSNIPLPLVLVGHEVDEDEIQLLYSLANDWRGTNFWKIYMAGVGRATEKCVVSVSNDAGEPNQCNLYANQLGLDLIGLARDFVLSVEGILRDEFSEEHIDDLGDNYISAVISKLMGA
ncbi:hypothetical protein ACGCUP_02895 [Eubacteriales bacterium KG125]